MRNPQGAGLVAGVQSLAGEQIRKRDEFTQSGNAPQVSMLSSQMMVRSIPQTISRRSFLKAGAVFALLPATAVGQTPIERGRFSEDDLPLARNQLLKIVNEERAVAGLGRLELDDLACRVANQHALDMVEHNFLSHWGSDGRKPYHRYSFAGGAAAVRENASAAEDIQSITTASVAGDLRDMHLSMLNELPPNDGHRKTILYPHQTHVGFGIALRDHSLRLDELYLAQYVEVDPLPREAKTKASLVVTGKLLSPKHALTGADVYYEPFPTAPAIEWLREPRSYGMPAEVNTLMPRLPERYTYNDGSKGTIELSSGGRFRIPVSLNKSPGINTIMVWIETGPNDDPFPATQICVSGQ